MARVLMVASEATPFVKTGGLADVLGGLPPALAQLGDQVGVVLPKYRAVELFQPERVYNNLPVWIGGTLYSVQIDRAFHKGVPYFFVNCPPLYDRAGIYNVAGQDFPDNHIRFAVLCRAAMEIGRRIFRPEIFHCHDWQTGLLPVYLSRIVPADPTFIGMKTLFTLHNLGYQGRFLPSALKDIGLDLSVFRPGLIEFFGDINLLKAGLVYSDAINTVSQGYAREIQTLEYGEGLDGLLRSRKDVLSGIVNGVDYDDWSPAKDKFLPAGYGPDSMDGKRACKRALLQEFGLPLNNMDRPLIGIVSRFATQKGFDLIAEVKDSLLAEDLALVVLGSGKQKEADYEQMFLDLAAAFPDRVGARIGYDNRLAHLIEGGSDMFLMPSKYEPCGLNQIYSLRYGTVPIVRATGGLDDTIDEGTGFKFTPYSGVALLGAVKAAVAAYRTKGKWDAMIRRGMLKDFSWNASAKEYSKLYKRTLAAASLRVA